MPRSSKQARGEIINHLQGNTSISQEDLEEAMAKVGVEARASVRDYTKKLIKYNYLARVAGGFRLTDESKGAITITIKVSPPQNAGEVIKGISESLRRYGKLTTMELELQ